MNGRLLIPLLTSFLTLYSFANDFSTDDKMALAQRTGLAIETLSIDKDFKQIDGFFDYDLFVEKLLSPYEVSDKFRSNFKQGIFSNGRPIDQMLTNFDASLTFKKATIGAEEAKLLFRINSDNGVNFIEFDADLGSKEHIKLYDFYSFASGEKYSESIDQLIQPALVHEQKGFLGKLMSKTPDIIKYNGLLTRYTRAFNGQEFEKAQKLYQKLPKSLKEKKSIMLVALTCASQTEDLAFLKEVVKRYTAKYPNDPSMNLLLVDYHYLNKNFTQARKCLRNIEKLVGKDAGLNQLIANTFIEEKAYVEAEKCLLEGINLEPQFADNYWSLVSAYIQQEKWQETAKTLDLISDRLNLEFEDFTSHDFYKEFVQSEVYKAWWPKYQARINEAL